VYIVERILHDKRRVSSGPQVGGWKRESSITGGVEGGDKKSGYCGIQNLKRRCPVVGQSQAQPL